MDKCTQTELSWFHDGDTGSYRLLEEPNYSVACLRMSPVDVDHLLSEKSEPERSIGGNSAETSSLVKQNSISDLIENLQLTDDNSCEEEEGEGDDDWNDEEQTKGGSMVSGSPAPPYKLPADNLPWPKLLQYLRESESAASKYFSISSNTASGGRVVTGCLSGKHPVETSNQRTHMAADAEAQPDTCHFCSKALIKIMAENEEPNFCCSEYKEFCILLAVFTKKMMDDKVNKMPGKIPIEKNRVSFMKTAEERAMERIRRKRKWEENEKNKAKLLETANFHSLTRQTRLIHFSLASPSCIPKEWSQGTGNGKVVKILTKQRKPSLQPSTQLPPLTIENTSAKEQEKACELKIQAYGSIDTGRLSAIRLPDFTGQYYYPSGNIGVVHMLLYPTVMCYILYEDRVKGSVIGYFDELGRGWLNKDEKSIRFLSTINEVFIFDYHGRMKNISWTDAYSLNNFLPLIFKVSRYLSIKYNNQNDVMITLTCEQQHHKFRILKKAVKNQLPLVDKRLVSYSMQLEKIKLRFRSHLDCFERTAKLVKTAPLPSIDYTHVHSAYTTKN